MEGTAGGSTKGSSRGAPPLDEDGQDAFIDASVHRRRGVYPTPVSTFLVLMRQSSPRNLHHLSVLMAGEAMYQRVLVPKRVVKRAVPGIQKQCFMHSEERNHSAIQYRHVFAFKLRWTRAETHSYPAVNKRVTGLGHCVFCVVATALSAQVLYPAATDGKPGGSPDGWGSPVFPGSVSKRKTPDRGDR